MELVINTPGSYIRKQDNCFLIKNEETSQEISVKKVSCLLITTGVLISTDAMEMALEYNVDIVLLDKYGDPYGRVWHSKLGSTTLIRRRQLEASCSSQGFAMLKEWIHQRIDNQVEFLKKLKDKRPHNETLPPAIDAIQEYKSKINRLEGEIDDHRHTIMGLEGNIQRVYFEVINSLMPEKYKFNGRSRMPALDEFNAMINYGYGVLYSKVEKACLIAGLDPYLGFLHTDNYNKKSLVFDLIEMYRILVDKTVVYLFTGKQIHDSFFDRFKTGFTLNAEGKAILISSLNETFAETVRYKNRNIKNIDKVQFDCHSIAQELLKEGS